MILLALSIDRAGEMLVPRFCFLNIIIHSEELRLVREMADFRAGIGTEQGEPWNNLCQNTREGSENYGDIAKYRS